MSATIYTDFGHLAGLRGEAQRNPNAALEEVASQFESLFLQQMLKSMRDATMEGGLFDSDQMETYQQMADKQLALQLADNGGIGLARTMVEQMQARGYVPDSGSANEMKTPTLDQGGLPAKMAMERFRAIDLPKVHDAGVANYAEDQRSAQEVLLSGGES